MNTGINRIRLEFKGDSGNTILHKKFRINRIRLEFKVRLRTAPYLLRSRINRIRLEFKDLFAVLLFQLAIEY